MPCSGGCCEVLQAYRVHARWALICEDPAGVFGFFGCAAVSNNRSSGGRLLRLARGMSSSLVGFLGSAPSGPANGPKLTVSGASRPAGCLQLTVHVSNTHAA